MDSCTGKCYRWLRSVESENRFTMITRRFLALSAGTAVAFAPNLGLSLVFNAVPDPGTPQYVIDAFSLATAKWTSVLGDDITVNINFGYQSLAPGTLGQTVTAFVQQDYSSVYGALNAGATSV